MTKDVPVNVVRDQEDRLHVLIGSGYSIMHHMGLLSLQFLQKEDVKIRLSYTQAREELTKLLVSHNNNAYMVGALRDVTAKLISTEK